MTDSVHLAAVFAGIPAAATMAYYTWSAPATLRQAPTYINAPRISSSANGHAIVVWHESSSDPATGGQLLARLLHPDCWRPATVISDGSGYLQPPAAAAIGPDGTAIVAWRQVIQAPSFQSQLVARRFVPGGGWNPAQVLSSDGTDPSLAIAPDGRAHIVFYEYPSFVARTLAPDSDAWSQTVVLGAANFTGRAQLVAGNGFAYAAFAAYGAMQLAAYTKEGWHPAAAVSGGAAGAFDPQLVANNGHVVLSWSEERSGSEPASQWVQRVTGLPGRFAAPRAGCRVALLPDGTILAACEVQGAAVPGCFEPSRGGPQQAFYRYVETYLRTLFPDWLKVGVLSDTRKRARNTQVLSDLQGDAFVLWNSDVPCRPDSNQIAARVLLPAGASAAPEATLPTQSAFFDDVTLDGRGVVRLLWSAVHSDVNAGVFSTLLAAELRPRDPNADLRRGARGCRGTPRK